MIINTNKSVTIFLNMEFACVFCYILYTYHVKHMELICIYI